MAFSVLGTRLTSNLWAQSVGGLAKWPPLVKDDAEWPAALILSIHLVRQRQARLGLAHGHWNAWICRPSARHVTYDRRKRNLPSALRAPAVCCPGTHGSHRTCLAAPHGVRAFMPVPVACRQRGTSAVHHHSAAAPAPRFAASRYSARGSLWIEDSVE